MRITLPFLSLLFIFTILALVCGARGKGRHVPRGRELDHYQDNTDDASVSRALSPSLSPSFTPRPTYTPHPTVKSKYTNLHDYFLDHPVLGLSPTRYPTPVPGPGSRNQNSPATTGEVVAMSLLGGVIAISCIAAFWLRYARRSHNKASDSIPGEDAVSEGYELAHAESIHRDKAQRI